MSNSAKKNDDKKKSDLPSKPDLKILSEVEDELLVPEVPKNQPTHSKESPELKIVEEEAEKEIPKVNNSFLWGGIGIASFSIIGLVVFYLYSGEENKKAMDNSDIQTFSKKSEIREPSSVTEIKLEQTPKKIKANKLKGIQKADKSKWSDRLKANIEKEETSEFDNTEFDELAEMEEFEMDESLAEMDDVEFYEEEPVDYASEEEVERYPAETPMDIEYDEEFPSDPRLDEMPEDFPEEY